MRLSKEIKQKIDEFKKQLVAEKKAKEQLLNSNMDFNFFENLIKKSNENPNLKIEITLKDGTRIFMRTYEEQRPTGDLINGDYLEIK